MFLSARDETGRARVFYPSAVAMSDATRVPTRLGAGRVLSELWAEDGVLVQAGGARARQARVERVQKHGLGDGESRGSKSSLSGAGCWFQEYLKRRVISEGAKSVLSVRSGPCFPSLVPYCLRVT